MPGDVGVPQVDREIARFEALQNDACIGDRSVALGAVQSIAERLRRSENVVEKPDLPQLPVARQSEAEHRIVQCFGGKLEKPDLAGNADAQVFPGDLTGREPGASQQRLEIGARLTQALCSQARRPTERLRLALRIGTTP